MSLCVIHIFRMLIEYDISTIYKNLTNYTKYKDMDSSKGKIKC